MIKRNKKLFSLILTATLIGSYTTTNIIPTTVLAIEKKATEKSSKEITKKNYSSPSDKVLAEYVEKLPTEKKSWVTLNKGKELNKFELTLTKENFYNHLTIDGAEANNKIKSQLKNKFKDEIKLIEFTDGPSSENLVILSTANISDLNKALNDIVKDLGVINETELNFQKTNIFDDGLKTPSDLPKNTKNVYVESTKATKDDYINAGQNLPSKNSIPNELNLKTLSTLKNFNTGLKKDEILAFYINDVEYSLDNVTTVDEKGNLLLSIELPDLKNNTIKFLTTSKTDNKLYDYHFYEANFEEAANFNLNLKPFKLSLSAKDSNKNNLSFLIRSNDLSIITDSNTVSGSIFAEINYKNKTTDIINPKYNPKVSCYEFFTEFSSSTEIADINLFYYNEKLNLTTESLKIPVEFSNNSLDLNDISVVNGKEMINLNIENLNDSFAEHYLVGINNKGSSDKKIKLKKDQLIEVDKLVALGLDKNSNKNIFKIESTYGGSQKNSTPPVLETNYEIKTLSNKFSLTASNKKGETLSNNGILKLNNSIHKDNYLIDVKSNHKIKDYSVTINGNAYDKVTKKDDKTLSIDLESLKDEKDGNYNLGINIHSFKDNSKLNFTILVDNTAPIVNVEPYDKTSYNLVDDIIVLNEGYDSLSFEINDNLGANEVKIVPEDNYPDIKISYDNNPRRFTISNIPGNSIDKPFNHYNFKAIDGSGNESAFSLKISKYSKKPEISFEASNNPDISYLSNDAVANAYVKKDSENITLFFNLIGAINPTINKSFLTINDGDKIAAESIDNGVAKFKINLNQLTSPSTNKIYVEVNDSLGVKFNKSFNLIINNEDIKNDSDTKTDRLKISLTSPDKTYNKKNLKDFDATDRPLVQDETVTVLELTKELKGEEKLTLNFEKQIKDNLKNFEKLKIEYGLTPEYGHSIDFESAETNKDLTFDLKKGDNLVYFKVLSSNGALVEHKLNIKYDPTAIDISFNHKATELKHVKPFSPELLITDENISEVSSILIDNSIDGTVDKTYENESLNKIKIKSEGKTVYAPNKNNITLSEGVYDKFSVTVNSTFGARRSSSSAEYPSFIVDGTAPKLGDKPVGFDESDKFEGYWALKKGESQLKFPLSDNYSSLSDLKINCSSNKVKVSVVDGHLVVSDIAANEKIDFTVTIEDLAGNSTTETIKVLRDIEAPSGKLTTEDENIYFEENSSVPSNFYIPIDYENDLKFTLALKDNFKLDLNTLDVKFKEDSIITSNNNLRVEPTISFKKLPNKKDDNDTSYFEIKLSNLAEVEAADLTINVSDIFDNNQNYEFKLNRNENTIENFNSIYKTNHINMVLEGALNNSEEVIKGELSTLDNIYKPLTPTIIDGEEYPTFQFADKFKNDMFYLDIQKTIPSETANVEKIKIHYALNAELPKDREKANTIGFNDLDSKPIAIKLKDGLNELNYEVVSTNGSKITNKIIFYYDVVSPTVSIKAGNDNTYYNFIPSIVVKDTSVDEINKIEVSYKFNGNDQKITYAGDELAAIKSVSNGEISYNFNLDSFADGKYTNFEVRAFSTFGTRRNNKDMFSKYTEFIIDTKGPNASMAVYNKNKNAYEILTSQSYYNTDKTDNPLLLLIEKEEFDDFNAPVNINNFNLNINGVTSENFVIENSSEIKIDDKTYFSYKIKSKNESLINLFSEGKFNVKFNLKDDANNHSNLFSCNYFVDKKSPSIEGKIRNKVTDETVLLDTVNNPAEFFINGDKFFADINDANLTDFKLNVSLFKGSSKIVSTYYGKTFNLTSEGYYEVEAIATDKAGNETKKYYKFNVDKYAPKVNLDSFNNNPIYPKLPKLDLAIDNVKKSSNPYISVDDSMNSTASTNVIITEKNSNTIEDNSYFNKTFTKSEYDISPNLKEGVYEIVVETIDKAGNKFTSAKKEFTIDTSKPVISIKSTTGNKTVENNKHYNTNKISTAITIDDVSTTSKDISFKINGAIEQPKKSISNGKYSTTYFLDDLTKDDIYNLEVIAGDRVSRESIDSRGKSTSNLKFAIDTKAPSLNVNIGSRIIDNVIYLNNHSTNLSVKATDEISKIEGEELTITTTINQAVKDNNYRFSSDGRYVVNVVATDKAGNKSTYSSEVEVDTVFPIIDFKGILPDHFYNKNLFPNIKFDSNDKVVNSVTLNGKPFDGSKIVEEGKHTLIISSTDLAGNKTELIIKFVIDKTAPIINVSGVKNNGVYTNKVTPVITYDDFIETNLTALLNNMEYSGQEIDADGFYTLFVKGVDKAGNTTEVSYKFKVNISAPIIEQASIEHGKTYTGPLTLDFKFKDAVEYKVLLNGKPYNGEEITEDGTYHVKVTAIDEDKNETVQEYTFYMNRNGAVSSSKKVNMAALSAAAIMVVLALLFYFKRKNRSGYSVTVKK